MSESEQTPSQNARNKSEKSADAFRTISEVSEELDVPQHVLRFWETKFSQVSPMKRGGGRRYYRPDDIRILGRIRDLLYVDGFTIKGVQKLMREHGVRAIIDGAPENPVVADRSEPEDKVDVPSRAERRAIQTAIAELSEIRKLLSSAPN